ncbi:hypothetical protein ACFYNW_34365 [Streptomyces virginiae]|uniref:hypothetical protein n=1 Tax=Streptomyces virginiae TaxID=1961 RepID=UPI0036E6AEE5
MEHDTDAGRTGELIALGQLLQACSRGVYPHLAPLIARRAEHLTGVPSPRRSASDYCAEWAGRVLGYMHEDHCAVGG